MVSTQTTRPLSLTQSTVAVVLSADDEHSVGLPVTGEAGALIGFPSDMLHEVTPITRCQRFSIVSWFY